MSDILRDILNRASGSPTLTANPAVFPGAREGDAGKVRVSLELVFASVEDMRAFFHVNGLPTNGFEPRS